MWPATKGLPVTVPEINDWDLVVLWCPVLSSKVSSKVKSVKDKEPLEVTEGILLFSWK